MFVRIKDPATGHESTVTEGYAQALSLTPLDKPAVDERGRPLPDKPKTRVAPAAKKTRTAEATAPADKKG